MKKAASDTIRSGGHIVPLSRRVPGPEERAFLRFFRTVYHRPELFPGSTWEVTQLAMRQGFRHPKTSLFRWTT